MLKIYVHCERCLHKKKHVQKTCENSKMLQKLFSVLIVTFCEENGLAEVEENDSNDILVCDDDTHKAVVCSHGYF